MRNRVHGFDSGLEPVLLRTNRPAVRLDSRYHRLNNIPHLSKWGESGCGSSMNSTSSSITGAPSTREGRLTQYEKRIRAVVSLSPLHSLWNLQDVPVKVLAVRTWRSMVADRIFGHAAELGFYFLFALFPTLFSASSLLGLAARSAPRIYDHLLDYLSLLMPTAALGTVLHTFNETTAASSSGKLTFGLIAAIW